MQVDINIFSPIFYVIDEEHQFQSLRRTQIKLILQSNSSSLADRVLISKIAVVVFCEKENRIL